MSAGGLSYSCITNYGRVTLPSVEMWGTNMNILRDPPRSIMTRKIDKVGETSSITEMIDQSGNRSCEAIKVFARGVNPSVSVSYSNYGNNGGGGQSGSLTGLANPIACVGRNAKLPYTIMRDGAFRPPILTQTDLFPLSRLPRAWTSAYSQPGFADFSKKLRVCGSSADTNEVKTTTLKACVRPTATYIVRTPSQEPYEVKYVIQPSIKTSISAGIHSMNRTQQEVKKPTKEINNNPLHAEAVANVGDTTKYVDSNTKDTKPYIRETYHQEVFANTSCNKHSTPITDILDLSDLPIRDIRTTSRTAPKSQGERTDYIHDDINLGRVLPYYQNTTNKMDKTQYRQVSHENKIELSRNIPSGSFFSNIVSRGTADHNQNRVAYLAPKLQLGGFAGSISKPSLNRVHDVSVPFETQKAKISRMVMKSMQNRFDKPAPWSKNT